MIPRLAACILFFKLIALAATAPVETSTGSSVQGTPDCNDENSDVFDQRQNGTENYRIHVNGVVVLVAPAETVMQAAQLGSLQLPGESEVSTIATQTFKPKPKPTLVSEKVPVNPIIAEETVLIHPKDPKDKNNLKLLNLLHMFRSLRHDSQEPTHQ